ncbi:hypothetical protein HUJ04_011838 [Dendroctonus ponderosae]|nr:hypothetical protein HUJ04_011838 [Dendroctonus ponderosae]
MVSNPQKLRTISQNILYFVIVLCDRAVLKLIHLDLRTSFEEMKCIVIALALLSIVSRLGAAPGGRRPPMNCMFGQMEDCQLDSGPVCGIDDSGILETFENKCMAYVMACQKDTSFRDYK